MVTTPNSTAFLLLCCALGFSILFLFIVAAGSIRIVPENARRSVFRLGRYLGEKGPGLVILMPLIDRAIRIGVNDQVQQAQAQQQMWGASGETLTAVQADGQRLAASVHLLRFA